MVPVSIQCRVACFWNSARHARTHANLIMAVIVMGVAISGSNRNESGD